MGLVEAAWRLVAKARNGLLFARLKDRRGKKRAIVAVALGSCLCALRDAQDVDPYQIVTTQTTAPQTTGKKLVRAATPDQTTTTGTTAPQTTRKKLVRAATPDQTTTTETPAPRTTRKKLIRTAAPTRPQPRGRRLLGQPARECSGRRFRTRPQPCSGPPCPRIRRAEQD